MALEEFFLIFKKFIPGFYFFLENDTRGTPKVFQHHLLIFKIDDSGYSWGLKL